MLGICFAESSVAYDPMRKPEMSIDPTYSYQASALKMTIYSRRSKQWLALLGGDWLRVGQSYDGYKVTKIDSTRVRLVDRHGFKVTWYLSKDVKRPSSS
jgi:hypothetical protein